MKEIIDLTEALIRFRSMHSKPEEIGRCADFIEDFLRGCEAQYRRLDHQGTPSLMVLPEKRFCPVLLMAHIDVVEGSDDLFVPRIEDGRLYGRGSIDDKYAVALCLTLLKSSLEGLRARGGDQGDLPFGILVTGDEEVGGYNGADSALKEMRADFCIVLDGGNLKKIVVKEKGLLTLRLISHGKAAHGARPWLGENAIVRLFEDYRKVNSLFQASSSDHWHRTLNFGIVRGGKSHNQVPDHAEAVFDIRYTENDDVDALLEDMNRQIQGELVVEEKEPLFQGGASPYLDLLLEIASDTKLGFEHGASDARFLSGYGIKGIVWGADGDESQHSQSEHVNIESLTTLYGYLSRFIEAVSQMK
jgi:succinyl-diaminopimelate desuccinylase